MGLLDWLTSDLGGGMGGMPPMNPMGDPTGAPQQSMPAPPPIQPTGIELPQPTPPISGPQSGLTLPPPPPTPPISGPQDGMPTSEPPMALNMTSTPNPPPYPPGGDPMTAGGATANGPGLQSPLTPPPLSSLPSTDISSSSTRNAPGAPLDLTSGMPQAGNDAAPQGQEQATTMLGRALGLKPSTERSLRGSLGAGFKAAGDSAGKSPFQAFSSGLGSGMEGGQKAEDKGYDNALKSLQLAVKAKTDGDERAYKTNYLKYLGTKLASDKEDKAADRESGGKGGKSGAWNKPDSQKFIDAQNAVSRDPDVKGALSTLRAAQTTGDPKAVEAATAALKDVTARKGTAFMSAMGLDPKKVDFLSKNPAGSRENPHTLTSKEDFDRYVQPGQAYTNPADGKVYIRKGGQTGASPDAATAATITDPSATPAAAAGQPPIITNAAPAAAEPDDNE